MNVDYEHEIKLWEGQLLIEAMLGRSIGCCGACPNTDPDNPFEGVWVLVNDEGHNSGFAGEGFSWVNFECGHSEADFGEYHDH
ncbi:MAG: hypothetical protein E6R03_12695 [Hyphomicrobiaceae bacterium]|nr:MAG: hypothetical protein E6R03_12695 [Hyphomicrobiaceae bacterium]